MLSEIAEEPLYAPYKLVQNLSLSLIKDEQLAARLPSILFALLTICGLYAVLRILHSERSAIAGSLAMAFNPLFLALARDGSPYIYLATSQILLFAAFAYVYINKRSHLGLVILSVAAALALYAPLGLVWLTIGLLMAPLALKNELIKELKKWHYVAPTLLGLLLVTPLFLYLFRSPANHLREIFLVPNQLPPISEFWQNYIDQAKGLFFAMSSQIGYTD